MDEQDAPEREMMMQEYQLLYCVRDLLILYARQEKALYGKISKKIQNQLTETEKGIAELSEALEAEG